MTRPGDRSALLPSTRQYGVSLTGNYVVHRLVLPMLILQALSSQGRVALEEGAVRVVHQLL